MVDADPDADAALLQKQSAPESGPDLASAVSPAECSKNTMPSKAKLPKVAADTLLAQRVLHFIKTTLSVQDLTKSQLKTIVRKSMVKVMTVIPRKFDQNTEQGTSAFLTDSRKQKINALLDQYVARLKAKANSKNSTPMTATPTTPTTPTV
jgi:arsenate reductase-like glutaredoxin family protein